MNSRTPAGRHHPESDGGAGVREVWRSWWATAGIAASVAILAAGSRLPWSAVTAALLTGVAVLAAVQATRRARGHPATSAVTVGLTGLAVAAALLSIATVLTRR